MKTCYLIVVSLLLFVVVYSNPTGGKDEVTSSRGPETRLKRKEEDKGNEEQVLPFLTKMVTIRNPTLRELCLHKRCNAKCLLRGHAYGGFCNATGCRCLQ